MANTDDDKPTDEGLPPAWVETLKSGKIPGFMLDMIAQNFVYMALKKLPTIEKLKLVRRLAMLMWPNAIDRDQPCDCACDACTSSCMHRAGVKP
jgi:hypothetical protein